MRPASEIIDISDKLGTPASIALLAAITLPSLALLVWALVGFWRANRRWKAGDALSRQAILSDTPQLAELAALHGSVESDSPVAVTPGRSHDEVRFAPFVLRTGDGSAVRVVPSASTPPDHDRSVVFEPGDEIYALGALTRTPELMLGPPRDGEFVLCAEPLGKAHRGRAIADLLLAIATSALVLGMVGASYAFLQRVASGEAGLARVVSIEKRSGDPRRGPTCHVVAKRPDGLKMTAHMSWHGCDDPAEVGNVDVGDRLPVVFVPGEHNDQFGSEPGAEGDLAIFVPVLWLVMLALYGFVRGLISQDDRRVASRPA